MGQSNSSVSKPDFSQNCSSLTTEICVLPSATSNLVLDLATLQADIITGGATVNGDPIVGIKSIKAILLYKGSQTSTLATPVTPTSENASVTYNSALDNLDAGDFNFKDAGSQIGQYLDASWTLEVVPGSCVQLDIVVASAPATV